MHVADAQEFVGKVCCVHWIDRAGRKFSAVSRVHEVVLMGIYGTFLVTDTEDIALEKITSLQLYTQDDATAPASQHKNWEIVSAA